MDLIRYILNKIQWPLRNCQDLCGCKRLCIKKNNAKDLRRVISENIQGLTDCCLKGSNGMPTQNSTYDPKGIKQLLTKDIP